MDARKMEFPFHPSKLENLIRPMLEAEEYDSMTKQNKLTKATGQGAVKGETTTGLLVQGFNSCSPQTVRSPWNGN